MNKLSDFFNIGNWLSKKMNYHKQAGTNRVKSMQVNKGEIWNCDLGYNIGEEKNKIRPVVVLSSNNVNRTGKVLVAPITDAKGKTNVHNLPQHPSWFLLFSNTADPQKMHRVGRSIPRKALGYTILEKDSIIQCEEMRCLSKARLLGKRGDLYQRDLELLPKQIKKVFDIS